MKWLRIVFIALLGLCRGALTNPATRPSTVLMIDSAPSVVSHQGSSQAQARLVIAPIGRSLAYVESTQLNSTELDKALQRSEKLGGSLDVLNISPIYKP